MKRPSPSLRLSPIVRLNMSFAAELERQGADSIFDDAVKAKLQTMHEEGNRRRDGLLKSLVISDAAILLLLYGRDIVIPGLEIRLSDLPAGLEMAVILASAAFMFACFAFFNAQAYLGLANVMHQKASGTNDPDFLAASESYTELFLKAYQPKLNIWGDDHFIAGRGYILFFGALTHAITWSLYALIGLHFVIMGFGLCEMLLSTARPAISAVVAGFAVWLHLCGVIVVATMVSDGFEFTVPD